MEFNVGHVKNTITTEQKKMFGMAWAVSSKTETADKVECQVIGATFCMWQWHMTFTRGPEVAYWNSPITQCTRGTTPPHPPHNAKLVAPKLLMPAHSLRSYRLASSGALGLLGLIAAGAALVAARLRRPPGTNKMNLQEPLRAAS